MKPALPGPFWRGLAWVGVFYLVAFALTVLVVLGLGAGVVRVNEHLPVQLSFDVSLSERAQRIRDLVGVARTCIFEIGRELIAARSEVAHGCWLPWLRAEFGWGETTARKYMAVFEAFNSALGEDFTSITIDATALYALSAPDVPQTARDEAVERAEDGEHISKADAEAMIVTALQAERAKFEAIVAEFQAATEEENAEGPPDIPTIVEQLCQATGQKKLKPTQLQQLACILGTAITDGSKIYPPSSLEETRDAEEQLRISAPAMRTLEYFLVAPDPDITLASLPPFLIDTARRCVAVAVPWLLALDKKLGSK